MVGVYLFLSVFAQFTPFGFVSTLEIWHTAVTVGTRAALASELVLAPSLGARELANGSSVIGSLPSAAPTRLTVVFEELNGLTIGSAVISRGEKIGTVVALEAAEVAGPTLDARDGKIVSGNGAQPEKAAHTAQIELDAEHRAIARIGTVALLASPRTVGRAEGNTIIELFAMSDQTPILESGARLAGYSSYEAFWSGRKAKAKTA